MTAKLIAEEGILKGLVLDFQSGEEWVIGRDPDQCEFALEDPSASRRHLLCRTTAEGFQIENLSDTNPVHVNKLEVENPLILHHGDEVVIGGSVWRFYQESEPQIDEVASEEKATSEESGEEEVLPEDTEQSVEAEEKEERDTLFEEEEGEGLSDEPALAEVDFDLTDTNPWLLKVIDGPNNGAEFSMQVDASYSLGSDPSKCDIVFHDVSVSREHAKLTIGADGSLQIEDLNSSNGTVIDGKNIEGVTSFDPNTVISLGTTTFIAFNREDEQHTVISPLLPAIVNVLKKGEEQAGSSEEGEHKEGPDGSLEAMQESEKEKNKTPLGTLVLLSVITGLFLIIGMGTALLFRSDEVAQPKVDMAATISEIMTPYPSINYSFNPTTGRLLLIGHVLTEVDRNQILYNVDALKFVSKIDDNVIVDEFIWKETNQVLGKNPNWKGVALHSPKAARFVLSGYLTTQKQADLLLDYMNKNFPYLELLERNIIVEEQTITKINTLFRASGIRDVAVSMTSGELTLSGNISTPQKEQFSKILQEIEGFQGIRNIKNFVAELAVSEAVRNITEQYQVGGSSTQGGKMSVFIKGKILFEGDLLDGMKITKIEKGAIFLDKEGVKYRIDY